VQLIPKYFTDQPTTYSLVIFCWIITESFNSYQYHAVQILLNVLTTDLSVKMPWESYISLNQSL
jgi:hypothetical protein